MKYFSPIAACVLFLAFGNSTQAQNEMRYVLLKSGRIVEGKLSNYGKQSKIVMPQGDYFVIPTEKVEKSFRTRRDVFNYKIAVAPLNPKAQDALLFWLCQQKEFERARSQLGELEMQQAEMEGFNFESWANYVREKQTNSARTKTNVTPSPTDSKTRFQQRVEQHLVLGCGMAGCHRSGSNTKYQLTDTLYDQDKKRLTNYESTMGQIRMTGKAKFLNYVGQKHGQLLRPIYPKVSREYLAIATWVNSLKLKSSPKVKHRVTQSSAKPLQKIPTIPRFDNSNKKRPNTRPQPMAEVPTTDISFQPKDEFDPEIFNRLQAAKYVTPETKQVPVETKAASAPQRLISPDKNNSKN